MEAINFFKPLISLLCKKITKRKESMKACEIYKKDKELKIISYTLQDMAEKMM